MSTPSKVGLQQRNVDEDDDDAGDPMAGRLADDMDMDLDMDDDDMMEGIVERDEEDPVHDSILGPTPETVGTREGPTTLNGEYGSCGSSSDMTVLLLVGNFFKGTKRRKEKRAI